MTKAFVRVREIHFFEAHTCHTDFEDAEKQILEDVKIAGNFFGKLAIPYIISKRPDWDKFAGAYYSLGIDVLMPSKKVLQVASIHQYRDNFSRPFEIKYEDESGGTGTAIRRHMACPRECLALLLVFMETIKGLHFLRL